jgi:hypothetical protein
MLSFSVSGFRSMCGDGPVCPRNPFSGVASFTL